MMNAIKRWLPTAGALVYNILQMYAIAWFVHHHPLIKQWWGFPTFVLLIVVCVISVFILARCLYAAIEE